MELYEQQSSYNPNMPVREFMYAGKLYDKFIHSAKLNKYGKKLLPLPLPKLVVFYNGEEEQEDETVLRLSDAFKEEIRRNVAYKYSQNKAAQDKKKISEEVEQIFQDADPDIEVKVRMVNINYGHNEEMLRKCKPLGEYAWFVAQVRKELAIYKETGGGQGIADAIDRAINEMPEDFEIKKFIVANSAEVKDMCLTEYDEAETMEMFREEGREEGRKEGREESIIKIGRRHMFSDDVIIRDLMEEIGYGYAQAKEILGKW